MQRVDKPIRGSSDFIHGRIERGFVGARRSRGATQLSYELERRRADLVVGRGWLEVGERLDVAAHLCNPRARLDKQALVVKCQSDLERATAFLLLQPLLLTALTSPRIWASSINRP